MTSTAELNKDTIVKIGGEPHKTASLVQLRVHCALDAPTSDYGVEDAPFSDGPNSVVDMFSNALRMEVQLDFPDCDTTASDVDAGTLGGWVGTMVKRVRELKCVLPCEVFVALTDKTHLFDADADALVAIGKVETGADDDPVTVLLLNRGVLVQVGHTGY
jgi:hypothetical protein